MRAISDHIKPTECGSELSAMGTSKGRAWHAMTASPAGDPCLHEEISLVSYCHEIRAAGWCLPGTVAQQS